MSDVTPRSTKNTQSRAKSILRLALNYNNIEPLEIAVNTEKKKKCPENVRSLNMKTLYARPYSMTSPMFNNFCENQTTYHSFYLHDLATNINILNKAFPKTNEQEKRQEKTILEPLQSSSSAFQQMNPQLDSVFDPINLICDEEMLSKNCTPRTLTPALSEPEISGNETLLFDNSDDSVADKDYCPSGSESSDSRDSSSASNSKTKKVSQKVKAATITKKPSSSVEHIQLSPCRFRKTTHLQRRNTVDVCQTGRTEILNQRKTRYSTDSLGAKNNDSCLIQPLDPFEVPQKKRKKYTVSLTQRKATAKCLKRLEYLVKQGCNNKCFKQCKTKFSQEDRENINEQFWKLTWEQRQSFVASHSSVATPKRKTTKEQKRNPRRVFSLKNNDGIRIEVCKVFFLTTLGYKKSNDRVLYNTFSENDTDKRGRHQKTPVFDRNLLSQHVESFHPAEPHYRREHAPLRRYIPSDINITSMHKDFNEKNPDKKVSYELYRTHIKRMNISFTRLGNEECEICESYRLHRQQTSHDAMTQSVTDCDHCVQWVHHHEKYKKARALYDSHKKNRPSENDSQIFVSSDLEKVIVLPRMESFKSVIFCQRLTTFNQTFAPVGKITNESKPVTVIWHDGIAGRKQEDIMSAFYFFILRNRDIKNVNIWLDNCSAQNKNWLLYSLLVYMVNSDLIATDNITLYYFEPGHTFMSCDQVHHQVELGMKKKGKIYDFSDFEEVVASINNSKVVVKAMTPENFINIPNYVSERRIQISNPRAYLKNMCQVCFKRNTFDLLYKNNFNDEYIVLRFMNDKYLKNPTNMTITFRSLPKGIEQQRKAALLSKLSSIIPAHKLTFWQNLPVINNKQTNDPKASRRNT